jgi:hypothetical protein
MFHPKSAHKRNSAEAEMRSRDQVKANNHVFTVPRARRSSGMRPGYEISVVKKFITTGDKP